MALTKVTGQVIKNTTDVTVGVLTVTNTLAVGGTVSIGGTLTYEDVTNIDSVGLITARNGINVSGGNIIVGTAVTLTKDGDATFTGIVTATTFSGALTGNVTGNVTGNISGGTVAGSTGTFSGAVSGTSGTFTGGLDITSNVDITDSIRHKDDTNTKIRFPSTDTVSIETAGAEQLRITSDGAIIKGLSNTGRAQFFHSVVNPRVQIEGAGDFDRQVSLTSSASTAAYGSVLIFGRQRSGAVGGNTVVQADDSIGLLSFQGHDGTNFIEGSRIESNVETGVGANDMPSNLRFFTNSGTTTLTERLRITSAGRVGIGENSPDALLHLATGASTTCEIRLTSNNTGSGSGDRGRINVFSSLNNGTEYQCGYVDIDRSSGTDDIAHLLVALNDGTSVAERVRITADGHILPAANDGQDLGSSSKRWRDIYTGDLNLSNKGNSNDVDGSWGDYTIQEGESDLFLINNRSGKKFKFNLTEVL